MNKLIIGDFEITQESGKLVIDTTKAPKGSTFQILAILSQFSHQSTGRKASQATATPTRSKQSGQGQLRTSKKRKPKRIHRLSVDHPIILRAIELKAQGEKTKDICSQLGISIASYYRWTREAQKQK